MLDVHNRIRVYVQTRLSQGRVGRKPIRNRRVLSQRLPLFWSSCDTIRAEAEEQLAEAPDVEATAANASGGVAGGGGEGEEGISGEGGKEAAKGGRRCKYCYLREYVYVYIVIHLYI